MDPEASASTCLSKFTLASSERHYASGASLPRLVQGGEVPKACATEQMDSLFSIETCDNLGSMLQHTSSSWSVSTSTISSDLGVSPKCAHVAQPPQSERPRRLFQRQLTTNSAFAHVAEAIQKHVPNSLVVSFHRSAGSAAARTVVVTDETDFIKAFEDASPTFLLVDRSDKQFAMAVQLARHRAASIASAVVVVLHETETAPTERGIAKIRDFIASGADDVLVMPDSSARLPASIVLSLQKAKASRQQNASLAREAGRYEKQCQRLFWDIAHEIVPSFPQLKPRLVEVSKERVADVDLLEQLGGGQYGAVHVFKRREEMGAVKVISKRAILSAKEVVQIATEYEVLKRLDHPNLVKVIRFVHGMQNVYIFMELVGNANLFQAIRAGESDGLSWIKAMDIFLQVSDGLSYCHSACVAHCDIKPENIVMADEGCVKLVDFGAAVDFSEDVPPLEYPIGTMPFMSPEIMCLSTTWYPAAADVWSVGVVAIEMLCGNHAFARLLGWENKKLSQASELPQFAEDLKSIFARDELEPRQNALVSITSLCKEPPPAFVIELIGDLLGFEPNGRISAADAGQRIDEFASSCS